MNRRRLIVANWKMHFVSKDVVQFFETFATRQANTSTKRSGSSHPDLMIAAPFTLLKAGADAAQNRYGLRVIAQNVHAAAHGAYTGEVSTDMIRDVGATGSLVGHSERRQYFAETDAAVAAKTFRLLECGMAAITCIGESLAQREAGQTAQVIRDQLRPVLAAIHPILRSAGRAPDVFQRWALAYEPVWAIGTGRAASGALAQEVHAAIRHEVAEIISEECASAVRILYGGSVKATNVREFLSQPDIDGALVGGASIDPQGFSDIVDAAILG